MKSPGAAAQLGNLNGGAAGTLRLRHCKQVGAPLEGSAVDGRGLPKRRDCSTSSMARQWRTPAPGAMLVLSYFSAPPALFASAHTRYCCFPHPNKAFPSCSALRGHGSAQAISVLPTLRHARAHGRCGLPSPFFVSLSTLSLPHSAATCFAFCNGSGIRCPGPQIYRRSPLSPSQKCLPRARAHAFCVCKRPRGSARPIKL